MKERPSAIFTKFAVLWQVSGCVSC